MFLQKISGEFILWGSWITAKFSDPVVMFVSAWTKIIDLCYRAVLVIKVKSRHVLKSNCSAETSLSHIIQARSAEIV